MNREPPDSHLVAVGRFVAFYREGDNERAFAILQTSNLLSSLTEMSRRLSRRGFVSAQDLLNDFLFHKVAGRVSLEMVLELCERHNRVLTYCWFQLRAHWKRHKDRESAGKRFGDRSPEDPLANPRIDPTFGAKASPPPERMQKWMYESGRKCARQVIAQIGEFIPSDLPLDQCALLSLYVEALFEAAEPPKFDRKRQPRSRRKRENYTIPWKARFAALLAPYGVSKHRTIDLGTKIGEALQACVEDVERQLGVNPIMEASMRELWHEFFEGLSGSI